MPTRCTLSLPDLELSYLEWHQGQEPLLLLHGLGDHALVWSNLADHLGSRYHIAAPDLRGHGETTKLESGYTFTDVIADIEALMDHLGWSSAHVVGHSWTGKLAPIWARHHPQRLRSMVLVDPIFIWKMPYLLRAMFPLLYQVLPFLKGMGPFESYEAAKIQAKQLKQYQGWSALQEQVFQSGIEQKPDGSWGSKFTVAARNGIFDDVLWVAGLIEAVKIPTLLVLPEEGLNRWEWQLQPYKKHLTQLQICQVPGNHWAFLVKPAAFNQAVENFLNTVLENESR